MIGKSRRKYLQREQVMLGILQGKPLKIIHELQPEVYRILRLAG
jgi:hypothetical protein